MAEKLITKSFERLLDKGKNRGFITHEELGKSLGKRNSTYENIERAFIILVDEKITLVEKKSQYQSNKKKDSTSQTEEKSSDKSDDPIRMYLREMGGVELLSREGEIAIAKRIEAGKDVMLIALSQSPITAQQFFDWNQKLQKDAKYCDFKNGINGDSRYIDYLKNTFDGIWTHDYDKDKKIGFHNGDKYDILYVPLEGINDLPKNIQSINELKEYHHIKIPSDQGQLNTNENFGSDYLDFKKTIKLEKEVIEKSFKINEEPLSFFYKHSEIQEMINNAYKKYKI